MASEADKTEKHCAGYTTGRVYANTETHVPTNMNAKSVEENTPHVSATTEVKPWSEDKMNETNSNLPTRSKESTNNDTLVHKGPTITSSTPKALKRILKIEEPKCHSAINTLTAIPPPSYPLTKQEEQLLLQINPTIFKVVTPIKADMLEIMTRKQLNRPYIEYLLK